MSVPPAAAALARTSGGAFASARSVTSALTNTNAPPGCAGSTSIRPQCGIAPTLAGTSAALPSRYHALSAPRRSDGRISRSNPAAELPRYDRAAASAPNTSRRPGPPAARTRRSGGNSGKCHNAPSRSAQCNTRAASTRHTPAVLSTPAARAASFRSAPSTFGRAGMLTIHVGVMRDGPAFSRSMTISAAPSTKTNSREYEAMTRRS